MKQSSITITDKGYNFIYNTNSYIVLKVLFYLLTLCNKSNEISLPSAIREQLLSTLNISNNQLSNALKTLKDNNVLTGEKGIFNFNSELFVIEITYN